MQRDGGSFGIRDRNAIDQKSVLIHPAQLLDNAAVLDNLLRQLQAVEYTHRVGPDSDRGADLVNLRCLFEDFPLKTRLLKRECGSQSADATADDRDLDHSAEIATKRHKKRKLISCRLSVLFGELFNVQENAVVNFVDHVVRPDMPIGCGPVTVLIPSRSFQ